MRAAQIYVSVVLKDGGTLYRDVWYPFGPISPYVNAALFGIFGVHIFVPYAVGIISALASAVFIFLAGIELGFPLASWATGAVVVPQALEPGWSSFALPYSSAAVYACLFSCAFLWILLRGLISGGWLWSVSLGILAAMALLSKPEFGPACFPVLLRRSSIAECISGAGSEWQPISRARCRELRFAPPYSAG
jgi:hypothetical protein